MKPMLFNTEMVEAILDGRKTQTRRIIKKPHELINRFHMIGRSPFLIYSDGMGHKMDLPYQIGEIIYVRETWCKLWYLDDNEQIIEGTDKYYYAADGYNPTPFNCFPDADGFHGESDRPKWRPSIHMPKEAARIFLKVTDITVERIQDISDEGCENEGVRPSIDGNAKDWKETENGWHRTFRQMWDSIYKNWEENPWVWVIKFERCEKPTT